MLYLYVVLLVSNDIDYVLRQFLDMIRGQSIETLGKER